MGRFNKLVAFFLLPGAVTEVCGFFSIHLLLTISSEAITVIHLAYTAVLLCIWLAAGWTVITHLGPHPNSDFLDGAYWSLSTMTTVGYGDIIPRSTWETVFVTIACIAGPCMCATIIANTASFMKNDDSSSSNSSHRKSCIQSFVSSHRPRGPAGSGPTHHHTMIARGSRLSDPLGATNSKDIRLASVDYFDLLQGSEMSGMDETQTIAAEGSLVGAHFTHHMKQLLIGDTVQASEVFNGASPFIMGKIISEMEPQYFTKGSLVLAAGDTSHLMYFVKSGVVQIYNQHGRRTQRLLQGDFFAASALLPGYHIITFRATAFKGSELWVLSRQRFADLVALYPEELSDKLMIHIEETAIRNTLRITDPLAPAIRALRHINNLREPNKSFIEPESMRYALWCVAITGVALYNAYMIPLRLAFGEQVPFNLTFLADYFGDFLCLLDVALNMLCLGYYDKDDLVLVRDRIKDNYIQKGHFVYHLMAALPTDLICVLMWQLNTPSLFSTSQLLSLLRLNRLIRLLDVRSLLGYIECVFMRRSTGATMSRDDGNDNGTILLNLVRLGKLLCLVFFAIHFVACIFFFIANEAHMRQAENWGDSLGIMRDCSLGDCEESPSIALLLHQYVYAMYWATATVSTVGYGDVVAISKNERIYNVLVFLVGTSVYAMAIVHLQDIVAQLNVTSGIFKARCDRISSFLQREGAADHVFRKVIYTFFHPFII